jgi:hypothetical protein
MKAEIHPREARLLEKQKVDSELTRARTELVRLRSERDKLAIDLRKGTLIGRYDVKLQLALGLTALRQRLMSFAYALPRRLVNLNEHEIGRLLDEEVRAALRDVASWPEKLGKPGWDEAIDADLRPAPEARGNGDGEVEGAARRERVNAKRRAAYAVKKGG